MSKPIGPREAALRAQREQRFQQNTRKEPRQSKKDAAVKALGRALGVPVMKVAPRHSKGRKNAPGTISEA
jgi:hypothetical protein